MQRWLMDIWEQGGPWITSIGVSLMVFQGASPAWGKGIDPAIDSALPLKSITSVSELSDVEPTDWAYQALQSLIERYGCVTGLPGGTI